MVSLSWTAIPIYTSPSHRLLRVLELLSSYARVDYIRNGSCLGHAVLRFDHVYQSIQYRCVTVMMREPALIESSVVAIAWRIIFSMRSSAQVGAGSLLPTLVVIVESGALYAGAVLGVLVAYLCNSNGEHPAVNLITPLVVSFVYSP